jgi:hypothetical protein
MQRPKILTPEEEKTLESRLASAGCAQAPGSASGRDQYSDLKLEINRLIWQYAPGETTLGTADEMACKILTSILAGKYLI